IKPFLSGDIVYLRPPYGSWRQQSRPDGPQDYPSSIVADLLNNSGYFHDYIGPVLWDIVGEDWVYWRQGRTTEECAAKYLQATESAGRGIILMHDSSEEEDLRAKNRTL